MFGEPGTSTLLQSPIFLSFFKWLIVAVFALYTVFAFIVTRQIHIMRKTVITNFSSVLRVVGYLHLAVSLVLFLFFFLFL